jgi:hypothetical protein
MNSQQFECSATPGKPRQRAQSATRRDLLAALEQPDPHGAFKVTEGDLEKSAPLVSRPNLLANDSGLFPFRFCAVHPKDAGD